MDSSKFDALTKQVAKKPSRRTVITALGAVVAGGAAGLFRSSAEAAYVCRPDGVVCSKNADCCGQICLPRDRTGRRTCLTCAKGETLCGSTCCPSGGQCLNGVCVVQICTPNGEACDIENPAACCSRTCGSGQSFNCGNFAFCCIGGT